MRTIEFKPNDLKCTAENGSFKAELRVAPSMDNALILCIEENKKHITFSLNRIEEVALYEFLKGRNE